MRQDLKLFLTRASRARDEVSRRANERAKEVEGLDRVWVKRRDDYAAARGLLLDFKQSLL